jgi:FAD/FMN-containing dehydrogenase
MSTTLEPTLTLADLRAQISGVVIGPDDPEYDTARAVHSPEFDCRPMAVVRPVNARDVARIVGLARRSGVELAVRSGGHSVVGHSTTDGGIVLELSAMKALDIDVDARTVWAQTGLTAGEVTRAVGAHGLAIGFGDAGTVGIGGLTLGGGIGYLVRKYGLTIDNLLAAEVVTADGDILYVDSNHHPDLFWAIRGGGGNFGVVTSFQYRLHPVDLVTGGMLVLPATAETIAELAAVAEAASEDLSLIANIMPAPPLPFIPASEVGKLVMVLMLVHAGPQEDAERELGQLRSIADPIVDLTRPLRYAEMFPEVEPELPKLSALRTLFLDRIDTAVAADAVSRMQASGSPLPFAQLRILGGAAARIPLDATAFAHRARRAMLSFGVLMATPDELPRYEAWSQETVSAFRQGESAAYVNFSGDDGPEALRAAYPPATWQRLSEVKRRYDPDNLFRLNHNIPPSD